jgi:hypothetical protein
MTAIVPQPGQLSPEAARLRQYLRWATIPNFVAIAALFAIYHVTRARPALIMALLIALNAVLMGSPAGSPAATTSTPPSCGKRPGCAGELGHPVAGEDLLEREPHLQTLPDPYGSGRRPGQHRDQSGQVVAVEVRVLEKRDAHGRHQEEVARSMALDGGEGRRRVERELWHHGTSLRKGGGLVDSGLVDAAGRWLVGTKGEYPLPSN